MFGKVERREQLGFQCRAKGLKGGCSKIHHSAVHVLTHEDRSWTYSIKQKETQRKGARGHQSLGSRERWSTVMRRRAAQSALPRRGDEVIDIVEACLSKLMYTALAIPLFKHAGTCPFDLCKNLKSSGLYKACSPQSAFGWESRGFAHAQEHVGACVSFISPMETTARFLHRYASMWMSRKTRAAAAASSTVCVQLARTGRTSCQLRKREIERPLTLTRPELVRHVPNESTSNANLSLMLPLDLTVPEEPRYHMHDAARVLVLSAPWAGCRDASSRGWAARGRCQGEDSRLRPTRLRPGILLKPSFCFVDGAMSATQRNRDKLGGGGKERQQAARRGHPACTRVLGRSKTHGNAGKWLAATMVTVVAPTVELSTAVAAASRARAPVAERDSGWVCNTISRNAAGGIGSENRHRPPAPVPGCTGQPLHTNAAADAALEAAAHRARLRHCGPDFPTSSTRNAHRCRSRTAASWGASHGSSLVCARAGGLQDANAQVISYGVGSNAR
ncbi:hypothetical protein C8R47DRAFT_1073368 [Mycena vitilis]|nr:hypothetical protein C8R47DRAFT_1073368 [Mycena vitilis]